MIQVSIEKRDGRWVAYRWGKSAAILRPVPGNTRHASAASWPTREAAIAELPVLIGGPIEVMRHYGE
jgi:hypothetical protein